MTQRTDGTYPTLGTTNYLYRPINPTDGILGDNKLHTVDGPWGNDTITYTYDALGRGIGTQIGGTANNSTIVYDNQGRVQSNTNGLNTFNYSYFGGTSRLTSTATSAY